MTAPARAGSLPRLVLFVLVVGAAIGGWFSFQAKTTSELPVYVEGAARMERGEPIYRKTDPKPFTYPPFFAVPFLPLVDRAERSQRLVWYCTNLAALCVTLWLAIRGVRDKNATAGARTFVWGGVVLLAGRHLSSVFENQSHDLVIALLVALGADAWRRGGRLLAGAFWGIATACKATPALFLWPLLLRRDWRTGIALGAMAAVATLLPDLVMPQDGGKLWVVAWFDTFLSGLAAGGTASAEGAWTAGSFLNQGLSGTLHRLTTSVANPSGFVYDVALVDLGPSVKKTVILCGQLIVVALLAFAARKRPGDHDRARERFGIAAAVTCGMVLLSPMSSKAHFCVLVLPAVFCTQALWFTRDRWLWALLLAEIGIGTLTVKGIVGTAIGNHCLAYGSVTWSALIALVATLRALELEPALELA